MSRGSEHLGDLFDRHDYARINNKVSSLKSHLPAKEPTPEKVLRAPIVNVEARVPTLEGNAAQSIELFCISTDVIPWAASVITKSSESTT